MIKLMKITVYFSGGQKTYYNISRTAVNYYIDWYRDNKDLCTYVLEDA